MKKHLLLVLALLAVLVLTAPAVDTSAITLGLVYTNDNNATTTGPLPNTVTVFRVNSDGSLARLRSVPTGGTGYPYPTLAMNAIKTLAIGDALFAVNEGTEDISVFSGARTGNLVLKSVYNPGDVAVAGLSMLVGGECLVVGYSATGYIVSYRLSKTTPYITPVTTIATDEGMIQGMAGVKNDRGVFIAAAGYGLGSVIVIQGFPSTCQLGTPSYLPSAAADYGGSPSAITFSRDGKRIYVGDQNNAYKTIIETGPFPDGPLTAYTYNSGGYYSRSLLVDKTGTCLYVANSLSPGVTAIPLNQGVPGTTSTYYPDGSGYAYSGLLVWHNSFLGFLQAMSKDTSNQVVTYLTEPGCVPKWNGAYSTGQAGRLYAITTYPQVGP